MRRFIVLLVLLLPLTIGCDRKAADAKRPFTADITMDLNFPGASRLTGKLYLSNGRVCLDWGEIVDVFDLRGRKGWRILPATKAYMDLGSQNLSLYAPEMTNGSPCPHARVPSECKLVAKEKIGERMANKWDAWDPRGFHHYFWTDETLDITVRYQMGDATYYEVKNLRHGGPVADERFELPPGYQRFERL